MEIPNVLEIKTVYIIIHTVNALLQGKIFVIFFPILFFSFFSR